MTQTDPARPRPPEAPPGTTSRRVLLGGALATTATVGALALLDAMPFVRDLPLPVPGRRSVRLTWLADALREAGLRVEEVPRWVDAGRPRAFDPVGVLMHHTAFRATAADPHPALDTVVGGRTGLRGPLCHVLIDRDGVCHVVAAGRANHAGEAVDSGPVPGGDGNTAYVGIEIDYAPQAPYGQQPNAAQGEAAVAAAAAVLARLGTDADHARYHAETSTAGKWDPGNTVDADEFRRRVAALLGSG